MSGWSKIYRTSILFISYLVFGISRSLQGPTILQLLEQVGSSARSFQVVFLLGAVTFPVGNLLCGMALERVPSSLLLSGSMAMLAVSVASIPMAASLSVLAAASGAAEFALGLLDTGINIYCLQLWGDASGPFVNALYLFQGVGFLLSPIMTECVLAPTSNKANNNSTNLFKFDNITQFLEAANFSSDIFNDVTAEVNKTYFTPVQVLYLFVSLLALSVSFAFIPGVASDRREGSYDFPRTLPPLSAHIPGLKEDKEFPKSKSVTERAMSVLGEEDGNLRMASLTLLMAAFFMVTNGTAFSFGHFLTAFVVRAGLGTEEQGARATSVYFAAQVLSRACNILLTSIMSRRSLCLAYLTLISCGSAVLLLLLIISDTHVELLLRTGCALSGFGTGALFPAGLLWAQEKAEIRSRAASLFVLAATCGAQLLRLPEAALIDTWPQCHIFILASGTVASFFVFIGANLVADGEKSSRDLNQGDEIMQEKPQIKA